MDCPGMLQDDNGNSYYDRYVVIENGDLYITLDYVIYEEFMDEAVPLFQSILDSVSFGTAQ